MNTFWGITATTIFFTAALIFEIWLSRRSKLTSTYVRIIFAFFLLALVWLVDSDGKFWPKLLLTACALFGGLDGYLSLRKLQRRT